MAHRPALLRNAYFWAIIIPLLLGLPFLNKPFHIDDVSFLAVAHQIVAEPLYPHGRPGEGGKPDGLFQISSSPLISYYYAMILRQFGDSEVILHTGMLLFLVIFSLATVSLAFRFTGNGWWPMLFLASSPAVVASSNLMMDIPAAALATAAAAIFIHGSDSRDWRFVLLAGLVAGLGVLAKYSAIVVFPPLVLYAVFRNRVVYILGLATAIVPVGAWFVQNLMVYKITHVQYLMALEPQATTWLYDTLNALVIIGSCSFIAIALVPVMFVKRCWLPLCLGSVGALLALFILGVVQEKTQYAIWCAFGLVTLVFVGWGVAPPTLAATTRVSRYPLTIFSPQQRDDLFLLFWLVCILLFSIFQVYFQAVRHLIPALVPLNLLLFRTRVSRQLAEGDFAKGCLVFVLLLQTGTALWVGKADYAYADSYRSFVQGFTDAQANDPAKIWFVGDWGFLYYAERAGWRRLKKDGSGPTPGDLLVIPDKVSRRPYPSGTRSSLEQVFTYPNHYRLLTMDRFTGASFYASVGYRAPYFISGESLETFRVYRVL
jgi:4-amino-4-deoxy-L-arabinose transferase-like glycosyltransferase|tara:strand:- start:3429 stop:5060 length:1632 start_codon:yes stop_codon:yes gene_type:complete